MLKLYYVDRTNLLLHSTKKVQERISTIKLWTKLRLYLFFMTGPDPLKDFW